MRFLSTLFLVFALAASSMAQTRIDSSFAFGPNPAKKYSLYIPVSYNPSNPNPVMVAFHPYDTSRWDSESWCDTLTNFASINDLILVCPDGDSTGLITDSIDYAFTTALLDSVNVWYITDLRRTYAMGFSMGGKAVYEYGLNHAESFGGFIPIGPAINGSSFVSNVIQNAGGKPFYLVHGSNDSPNSRFYPMITALRNVCALVDSNLMSGIGHTIDFPNRNLILSSAYAWVDSVNTTSVPGGAFSLQAPANLSSITIKGFTEYVHQFAWGESALKDTCGVLKYEVLFDVPNGNFSNPLLTSISDNGGLDTVLSVENVVIDSIMRSYNVPINGSMVLDWTVRSNLANRHSDTAKSFRITFVRKKIGFNITTPTNNDLVVLENGSNKFFNWEDLNHYISVKYNMLIDDTSGDYSNPWIDYLSTSNGNTSSLNQRHEQLYYDLMFTRGLQIGDTMHSKWIVKASDTSMSEFSQNERNISFVRGNVGFKLFEPVNNALITSKLGTDYLFKWDSVTLDQVRYEWLFDTLGVDLHDTASIVFGSNSDSTSSKFDGTFQVLDSIMNFYQVDYLDTLYGQWTIRANRDSVTEYSLTTYNITIYRAHPVGIEDANAKLMSGLNIYPNPASDMLQIVGPVHGQLRIIDISGKVMIDRTFNKESTLLIDVSSWTEGSYMIQIISDKGLINERFIIKR